MGSVTWPIQRQSSVIWPPYLFSIFWPIGRFGSIILPLLPTTPIVDDNVLTFEDGGVLRFEDGTELTFE